MTFFNFDVKEAIAISNGSIFTASLIRYLLNFNKPHPLKNGKGILVDMNLTTLMLPFIISGVSVGVLINILAPGIAVRVAFIVVILYLAIGIFRKILALRKKENEAIELAKTAEKGKDVVV